MSDVSDVQAKCINTLQTRIKRIARAAGRTLDSLLLLYLQERFLFRLAKSPYRDRFILKGGLLIRHLTQSKARPTRDIDLLAQQVSPALENIESVVQEICQIPVEDGVTFDLDHLSVEAQENDINPLVTVKVTGFLGKMKGVVKLDLSFKGITRVAPLDLDFPVLLDDLEPPHLKMYSLESSIAEKFQAMVVLSVLNTRMKDFYDIYTFASCSPIDGKNLLTAVVETFHQRNTPLDEHPAIFTPEFSLDSRRVAQWDSYLGKISAAPIAFPRVMAVLTALLQPIFDSIRKNVDFSLMWNHQITKWVSRT